MDNRNFRRNDRGPIRQRSALAAFVDKNGIYLVMLVCLALIGVTAYFTLGTGQDTASQPTPSATQQAQAANQNNGATLQDEMNRLQQVANATPTPTTAPSAKTTAKPDATPKVKQTVVAVKPVMPVKGDLLRPFSDKDPVYFQTLNAWMIHKAADIKAEEGTAVVAMMDGTVASVSNEAETGYTIVIQHAGDVKSTYGNLQAPDGIKKGQKVKQGEKIGTVGKSASNTANDPTHLHFAVSVKGVAKDPIQYVKGK